MLVSPTPYSCSKSFSGYPCCHRQWRHQGHCRFVHGYSRSFNLWFAATELDACGFVVDFSSLRPFEERLRQQFDHTFLVNADDPLLAEWQRLHDLQAIDLRVMENVGMEGTAAWRRARTAAMPPPTALFPPGFQRRANASASSSTLIACPSL